jgi:hypothetical protein
MTKNIPNDQKMYRMTHKRPNDHKIDQHFPLQDLPKFTQIGNFGMKTYHLATLLRTGFFCSLLW